MIPPPIISLNKPKKMATIHIIMPPFDLPNMENTNPNIAKGIFNQFNQPNKGIIPSSIPIIANIPNNLPSNFILIYCGLKIK